MDNLTHSLVGLFLARAGFRYATPRATAVMVLAANIPDIDAVSWLQGGAAYIHYHRNLTHSLFAAPVMAIIAVAAVRVLGGKPVRWLNAWLIALIAVASHLLLDLTNIYGVRLLLPFSGRWFHQDSTPVIDFAIWTILLLGVLAPLLVRLVGSEIGERRRDSGKAGWAVTALVLLCAWDYGRSMIHERAIAILEKQTYNGLAPRRTGAFPDQNPLVWNGAVELSNAFITVPVDLRTTFHPSDERTWLKPQRTPALEAAIQTAPFQTFLEFVQWPLWVVEPGHIALYDLRFGTSPGAFLEAAATVDAGNRIVESQFLMGSTPKPR